MASGHFNKLSRQSAWEKFKGSISEFASRIRGSTYVNFKEELDDLIKIDRNHKNYADIMLARSNRMEIVNIINLFEDQWALIKDGHEKDKRFKSLVNRVSTNVKKSNGDFSNYMRRKNIEMKHRTSTVEDALGCLFENPFIEQYLNLIHLFLSEISGNKFTKQTQSDYSIYVVNLRS
jgi:hypothetical protein